MIIKTMFLPSILGLCICLLGASQAAAITLDFETEDDGVTPLGNGQKIDVGSEFGTFVDISSGGPGPNLGPAIFDSTDPGPNSGGADKDLLVNLGNILILQNDAFPAMTGDFFDTPNDEEAGGTVFFDWINPVEMTSIDLVDINGNGPLTVILEDSGGDTRTYAVPMFWTFDVQVSLNGYDTLDLTTLLDQIGEDGGTATASETAGFDPTDVVQLRVVHTGSAGLDNVVFIPEPGSALLLAFGSLALLHRRRSA